MHFGMHPDMVYRYPIWGVGLLLGSVAVLGAVLLEIITRRLVSIETRRRHNDVAAAMFSIVGVTYAVLLAFVAMLAWNGFNKAKAASYMEAAAILDVYNASLGSAPAEGSSLRSDILGYTRRVVTVEWPAQAEGHPVDQESPYLDALNRLVLAEHPTLAADADLRLLLLQSIMRLRDARQERLLAAQTTVPGIVWFVVLLGGALTIAFGSFLGSPSLGMQLAMSAVLAVSGSLVVILILALSQPFRGDFRVSTRPYERALSRIVAESNPP
jgi:hypothetical protein